LMRSRVACPGRSMTDRFSSSSFLLWMAFSGWLLAPSSSFVVSWLPARGAPALRGLAGAHCRRSCRSAGGALACQQGPRQVGDVVGYVHGGKYQFGEGGDSAGKSLGADYSGASAKQEPQGKEEPFPRWAEGDFSPGKVNGEVRLVSPGDMAEVRIVNEVRLCSDPCPSPDSQHEKAGRNIIPGARLRRFRGNPSSCKLWAAPAFLR